MTFALPWDKQSYIVPDGTGRLVDHSPLYVASPCHACHLGAHVVHSGIGYSWPFKKSDAGPDSVAPRPILFVGEAPGSKEDLAGAPFVGPAGTFLWESIRAAGIPEELVALSNVVQCYAWEDPIAKEGVRAPTDYETAVCHFRLAREIHILNPALIVPVGASASDYVLRAGVPDADHGTKAGQISAMRGQLREATFAGKTYPVFPTFHPSGVLRNRRFEHLFRCDLRNVKAIVDGVFGRVPPTIVLKTTEEVRSVCGKISRLYEQGKIKFFTFDFESTGLYPWSPGSAIVGVSLAFSSGVGYYIPLSLHGPEADGVRFDPATMMDVQLVKGLLRSLIENVPSGNQNLKFEYGWAYQHLGVRYLLCYGDPMLGCAVLFGAQRDRLSLDRLLTDYCHFPQYDDKLEKYKAEHGIVGDYSQIPLSILGEYGGIDAAGAYSLIEQIHPMLVDTEFRLPYHLTMSAIPVYAHIELVGVTVDRDLIPPLRKKFIRAQRKTLLNVLADSEVQRYLDDHDKAEHARIGGLKLKEEEKQLRIMQLVPWKQRFENAMRNQELLDDTKVESIDAFIAAVGFNPGSPSQVGDVVFDYYKVPVQKKWVTPTGKRSTAEEIVDQIARYLKEKEPESQAKGFLDLLLEYRGHVKMRGTYVDGLEKFIRPDGTLQVQYNINGAVTGRLSAEKFAFHQIPRDKKLGLRNLIISRWRDPAPVMRKREWNYDMPSTKDWISGYPEKGGGLLLTADYEQLELKVLAIASGDPGMIEAFSRGYDLHRFVASKMFYPLQSTLHAMDGEAMLKLIERFKTSKPFSDAMLEPGASIEIVWKRLMEDADFYAAVTYKAVIKAERAIAKNIGFGIVYGSRAEGVAKKTEGKTVLEIQGFMDDFFRSFSKVKEWIDRTHSEAIATAASHTLTHRTRWHFSAKYAGGQERDAALREAQNAPIQGTASDICVMGNILISKLLRNLNLRSILCGSVHDSSMIDLFPGEFLVLAPQLKTTLEGGVKSQAGFEWIGACPVTVDVGIGTSFGTELKVKEIKENMVKLEGAAEDIDHFLGVFERGQPFKLASRETEATPDGPITKLNLELLKQ